MLGVLLGGTPGIVDNRTFPSPSAVCVSSAAQGTVRFIGKFLLSAPLLVWIIYTLKRLASLSLEITSCEDVPSCSPVLSLAIKNQVLVNIQGAVPLLPGQRSCRGWANQSSLSC